MPFVTHSTTAAFVDHTAADAFAVRVVPATNLSLSNQNILDSSVPGTVVGTMTATFVDGETAPQWILLDTADGKYAIDIITGVITVAAELTAGTDTVVVQISQGGKGPTSASFAIDVSLEVIATAIVFVPNAISDLAAIGTTVGTASTTDGLRYVWSLTVNAGRWAINATTGAVTSTTGLIADTDVITIRIAFGTKTYSQSFSIVVSLPTITSIVLPLTAVYTNAAAGQQIAQASVTGTSITTATYAIPSGHSAGGMFAISSDGVLSVGSTALSVGTQSIEIIATPAGGNPITSSFNIAVYAPIIGFQILSYPITADSGTAMSITGSYSGTAPSAPPSAYWSGSGGASVVTGWTATNNAWSCAITTPVSTAGSMSFTLGGVTVGTVLVSAGVVDLPPGIHCPSTLIYGQFDPGSVMIGSYVLRGFATIPTVTVSDTIAGSGDSQTWSVAAATCQIVSGGPGGWNYLSTKPSWAITLTASDGISSYSTAVVILNPTPSTPYYKTTGNVVFDNATPSNNKYYFCNWGDFSLYNGATVSAFTFSEATGVIQFDPTLTYGDNRPWGFYVTGANLTAYGSYPVTITLNGTTTYQTTLFIAHKRRPIVAWSPGINVFDNTPALSLIGRVNYYDDYTLIGGTGVMTLQVPENPSPGAYIGVLGYVTLIATPSVGNYNFIFSVQGQTASTLLALTVPVAAGITLPATNITYTALPTLDNSMAWLALPSSSGGINSNSVLITTLAVSGFTRTPTWSIIVKTSADLPDSIQANFPNDFMFGEVATPRYTFNGPVYLWSGNTAVPQVTTTGTSGITLWASYLSAQTDHVYLTADDGHGTRCTVLLPVVVAAKIGPSIDVGPGQTYTTGNALLQAWWANRSAFNGAVVTVHPGIDASTDFNYQNQRSNGYINGWWPGPVTLQSPVGSTVRTVFDWKGWNNGSLQSGIVSANFDMTLINLEICNVTENGAGGGAPNACGVYMTGLKQGNLTMTGCYIYNCDNGLMNGDCTGRHVTVDNCIFERNGTNYYNQSTSHNMYVSTVSSFTCSNTQSDCSTDDHAIKSRAMVTTITNSKFRQGAQSLGSGSPVDCPLGGLVTISGCTMISAANPGNPIFFESGSECGPTISSQVWSPSITTITNNTFYNFTTPAAYDGGLAPMTAIEHYTSIVPFDGSPFVTTYTNNQFYNIPHTEWITETLNSYPVYYGGSTHPLTDGGGNVALTTYTAQLVVDPLTGLLPIHQPRVGFVSAASGTGLLGLMSSNSLQLDFVMATAPALGTVACTLNPYDTNNNMFTGTITYTMVHNGSGLFAFGSGGNIQTAQSNTPDGLYFVQVQATGTGVNNGATTASTITTAPQWVPIIVGTGHVAAS